MARVARLTRIEPGKVGMRRAPVLHRTERLLVLLAALACGDELPTDPARASSDGEPQSICPGCPTGVSFPVLFGADAGPDPCKLAEQRSDIDRARAVELGFDVDLLEQRVTREIRAPLRWSNDDNSGRTTASGYELETTIEGDVTVGSYHHVALDPALCAGQDCDLDGSPTRCSDRVELDIEVDLYTLDGAIQTHASGSALSARSGFAYGEYPGGIVFASLSEANGSLDLLPDPTLPIVTADVVSYLRFKVDQTEGDLRPSITQAYGPAYYTHNINGHWPDPP